MDDWKKKMQGARTIEKKVEKFRLVGDHILPDTLIRQGGYNPIDFPESQPPTIEDVGKSLSRIKELEEEEKLKLFEIKKSLDQKKEQ